MPSSIPPHDHIRNVTEPEEPHIQPEVHEEEPLPVAGFQGTPEEIERQWFEKVYTGRGDSMAQLTWRAVIMGSLLGGVLSLTNLYIGLKAGWGFGVAITACILSYAIWTTLHKLRIARTPMTILENNCMQSTASSAGYSTGGTLVSAFAAYILLNNDTLPYPMLLAWIFFLALLGVTMAIPMKRQMINVEQLRFPSGIAAAETLRALHSKGDKGMRSARALGVAALLSACSTLWMELGALFPGLAKLSLGSLLHRLNVAVIGPLKMSFTTMFYWDPIFIAAGIFTGLRVCISMIVSATLCWAIFCPIMLNNNTIKLTIREPIPYRTAGIDFAALMSMEDGLQPEHDQEIKYFPQGSQLFIEWRGIMSAAQRDFLLAQSDDPYYQSAIRRLFIRSQYRASAPLAALPPDVAFTGNLNHAVSYDNEKGLIAETVLSVDQYRDLKALSPNPEYQAAVDEIYALSSVPSVEPLWASVPLEKLPDNFQAPAGLGGLLSFDEPEQLLLWRGRMSEEQRAALLEAAKPAPATSTPTPADNAAFTAAIDQLYRNAQNRELNATLPDSAAGFVSYDPERTALVAQGPIPEPVADQLGAVSTAPAYQQALGRLVIASGAPRAEANFRDLVGLSLWAGTACMVTSGLLAFALQWKSALRAFRSVGQMFSGGKSTSDDPVQRAMDAIETPASWFIIAQLISLVALAILAKNTFDMPYWQSTLAVILAFFLALVACRVTGETDTTPVGAMGKITQLIFGGVAPASMVGNTTKAMNINLMAANITAAAAGGSADLLTDLKSGYLLGAHPRKQFLAQFAGIFIGTIVTVSCFSIMVPRADVLGSDTFPAPAALTWKAVAEALSKGLHTLGEVKIWCIVIGGLVGIILPVLAVLFPKKAKYMPSAAGVGLAWTFHWYYSLMFFVGAVIGYFWEKKWPKNSEEYAFPVASGVVAGGALMGVAIIFWENGPEMIRQIFGQLFGG